MKGGVTAGFKGAVAALLLLPATAAGAADLSIAAASNFTRPLQAITPLFERESGIRVRAVFSSTGKLFAMIENGAPFDLFLAADARRPELLTKNGHGAAPFTYAVGRPLFWSSDPAVCEAASWQEAARSPSLLRIAIPEPATAPYGWSAATAVSSLPRGEEIRKRFVFTGNAAQAFQYAATITGAGFTSASFARSPRGAKGCGLAMPEAPKVVQKGCILKGAVSFRAAARFASFLQTARVQAMLTRFGYELP